jgi:endonuclease G
MKESFYMSNICPQSPPLNRGIWKDLESSIRKYVKNQQRPLFIITGPVISENNSTFQNWQLGIIGKTHRVVVPKYFFKAILDTVGIDKSVAYIIPNSSPNITFQEYKSNYGGHNHFRITVDSLEQVLNRNLFPGISTNLGGNENQAKKLDQKNKVESKIGLIIE